MEKTVKVEMHSIWNVKEDNKEEDKMMSFSE